MNQRDKAPGKYIILLVALSVFDPVRCTALQSMAQAAQFPPAIVITEGRTTDGFPYLSGGVGADERLALEERAEGFTFQGQNKEVKALRVSKDRRAYQVFVWTLGGEAQQRRRRLELDGALAALHF